MAEPWYPLTIDAERAYYKNLHLKYQQKAEGLSEKLNTAREFRLEDVQAYVKAKKAADAYGFISERLGDNHSGHRVTAVINLWQDVVRKEASGRLEKDQKSGREVDGELGAVFAMSENEILKQRYRNYVLVAGFDRPGQHGIDQIYQDAQGNFLLVEAKGWKEEGVSKTKTKGVQMSGRWIKNSLKDLEKQNPELAAQLSDALEGRSGAVVEGVVINTDKDISQKSSRGVDRVQLVRDEKVLLKITGVEDNIDIAATADWETGIITYGPGRRPENANLGTASAAQNQTYLPLGDDLFYMPSDPDWAGIDAQKSQAVPMELKDPRSRQVDAAIHDMSVERERHGAMTSRSKMSAYIYKHWGRAPLTSEELDYSISKDIESAVKESMVVSMIKQNQHEKLVDFYQQEKDALKSSSFSMFGVIWSKPQYYRKMETHINKTPPARQILEQKKELAGLGKKRSFSLDR